MGEHQFINSIKQIIKYPKNNKLKSFFNHLVIWQFRKAFNLYPFILNFSESKIIATDKNCGVSALINSLNVYDYNNMNLLKVMGQISDTSINFIDIGANIGSYSILTSENDKFHIFAFEPHPQTYQKLVENIKLNQRESRIKAINMAITEYPGPVKMSNSAVSALNHVVIDDIETNLISVPGIPMANFLEENQVIPNIVKIDVEGFEYACLKSFKDYLKKVDLLIIEINGYSKSRYKQEQNILNLLSLNLQGPYKYFHDKKLFSKNLDVSSEDMIFISNDFKERNQSTFKFQ